jgi:hypothetical protein
VLAVVTPGSSGHDSLRGSFPFVQSRKAALPSLLRGLHQPHVIELVTCDVRWSCQNQQALRIFRAIERSSPWISMLPARDTMPASLANPGSLVAMWLWRKRSSVQDEVLASSSSASAPCGLSERSSPTSWVHRYLSQASAEFMQSLTGKRIAPRGPDRVTILRSRKRPACLGCGNELMLAHVFPIVPNHELRWFECANCGYPLNVVTACNDPIDLVEDRPQYAALQRADQPVHPDA